MFKKEDFNSEFIVQCKRKCFSSSIHLQCEHKRCSLGIFTMYKMTTMYTYLVYPLDIFGSPNNYVKVKMVQTYSWGNENIFHETYITQFQYHF